MNEINFLFTHLSVEEVIILVVVLVLVIKSVWSAAEWIWAKIKEKLEIEDKQKTWATGLTDALTSLDKKIDSLESQNQKTHEEQESIKNSLNLIQERLQENTRSYLIDTHHRHCYQIQSIDDLTLQSMERRYLYYKTAGGNSFIDGLMEEVRALPRINTYTSNGEG